jgi:hypothetical protein
MVHTVVVQVVKVPSSTQLAVHWGTAVLVHVGVSVLGGSVAGGSVTGGSVAGGSVAGGSVAGGSVAGGHHFQGRRPEARHLVMMEVGRAHQGVMALGGRRIQRLQDQSLCEPSS